MSAGASQRVLSEGIPEGTLVAGKYLVGRQLGRGGMGAVYLARHVSLGQEVALKVLSINSPDLTERFFREARAAARMQSDYVVRVSDIGQADDAGPYMVMERLVGTDLAAMLESGGPLSVIEAVDAIVEASAGLGEAHALGIVHRDIKPSNLFLADRPGQPSIVKVLDFGISKVTELDGEAQKLTETRTMMGSPYYMSPEQLRSAKDVDARADVWSMGVVLYELLSGRTPFEGETVGAVFANILEVKPPPLRELRPDIPPELAVAVERCLMRERSARFSNIGELALALVPFGSRRAAIALERSSLPDLAATGPARVSMADARAATDPNATTAPAGKRTRSRLWLVFAAGTALAAMGVPALWVLSRPATTTTPKPNVTEATATGAATSAALPTVASGASAAALPSPGHLAIAASAPAGASASATPTPTPTPTPTSTADAASAASTERKHRPRTNGKVTRSDPKAPPAPPTPEPSLDLDRRR